MSDFKEWLIIWWELSAILLIANAYINVFSFMVQKTSYFKNLQ